MDEGAAARVRVAGKATMKRWAWLVAGLYVLALVALTLPAILLAFAPKVKVPEAASVFASWAYPDNSCCIDATDVQQI
jgi:hypothetical protein